MRPFFSEHFGNAASMTHAFGWRAEEAVKLARAQVAGLINASDPKEIVWTSGTTESINLALIGAARANSRRGDHIVSCVTEHRAVLEPLRFLETEGFRVTLLPVDGEGLVDLQNIRKAITDQTILLSFMAANNEIGTIHPTIEIGKIAKERGALYHVDAAQACGKIAIDVEAMGIDLLSMSAHKVYGPKGIGALYVRARNPHVALKPILYGGGQERGLRPGTLAVPNIVGMGKAFEIAGAEMNVEAERLTALRERLKVGLFEKIPGVRLNGHPTKRLPGNLNVSFAGIHSDALIPRIRDVALSSGSACASLETAEPSYVIHALGGDVERALTSIRFGIGRFNTEEEIDFTIDAVAQAVRSLSSTTPASS
jgi:cysteine desulfurase